MREVGARFPAPFRALLEGSLERAAYHAELILTARGGAPVRYCDVGSGIGVMHAACAVLGAEPTILDDFGDPMQGSAAEAALNLLRSCGVRVISADALNDPFPCEGETLDAVTSFDCVEHLPRSPRGLLHSMVRALKPGGLFLLSAPNCVDVHKRVTVPLGYGSWSTFESWYEQEVFRSHVREPSIRDLRRIAADLKLDGVRVFGRNWSEGMGGIGKRMVEAIDPVLRWMPFLCLSLYMSGRKPAAVRLESERPEQPRVSADEELESA